MTSIDTIPVANTPTGGFTAFPPPILAAAAEPLHDMRCDGEHMLWQYIGFNARLERLGSPDFDPAEVHPHDPPTSKEPKR